MPDHSKAVDLSILVQNEGGRATSRELCLASAVINMAGEIGRLKSALESLKHEHCFCQSGDNPMLAGHCLPSSKQAMAALKEQT